MGHARLCSGEAVRSCSQVPSRMILVGIFMSDHDIKLLIFFGSQFFYLGLMLGLSL